MQFFTPSDLKELNSIVVLKGGDRAFIRKCLETLYRDDLTQLRNRSLGNSSVVTKKPITPAKISAIHTLMINRLKTVEVGAEKANRMNLKYIRSLISESLYRVKNSIQKE